MSPPFTVEALNEPSYLHTGPLLTYIHGRASSHLAHNDDHNVPISLINPDGATSPPS